MSIMPKKQMSIFEEPEKVQPPEDWVEHWEGMPEFTQEAQRPYAQIIFRFKDAEDLQKFATIIGQKLTKKTKSAWFPFKSHWGLVKKIWQDES